VRLRTTLTVAVSAAGTIACGLAFALVLWTSSLNRASTGLALALERTHLLMSVETYAVQHAYAGNGELPQALEAIDRLRPMWVSARTDELDALRAAVEGLAGSTPVERERRLDRVSQALRVLVDREGRAAQQAAQTAERLNRVANLIAGAGIVLLLLGGVGVLIWIWRGALQPLLAVAQAIDRFASGDAASRAPETGPDEIRHVATAFNDMAASLSRQREQQLAFVGGVAHDLRTPLNALRGSVAMLGASRPGTEKTRVRIERQVTYLARLVDDLLDRTRIEAGRLEVHIERCDLRDTVRRAVDEQREAGADRNFRLSLPQDPVEVECDPVRIRQVLANLLSNAVKYSPNAADVEVALERTGARAVLSVADHGIGIAAAERPRIFEPFSRGTNVGAVGGAGLGLSVTRKIVEAHRGRIHVRSEPGHGSLFEVQLPLARAGVDDAGGRTSSAT
jgi:signal transduction histidine kinase